MSHRTARRPSGARGRKGHEAVCVKNAFLPRFALDLRKLCEVVTGYEKLRNGNELRLRKAQVKSGGGAGIRTLVTEVIGETVFETAAFNRSATPPAMRGAEALRREPARPRVKPFSRDAGLKWRRGGDSNPGYAFGAYTISNRAPSASSDTSPRRQDC